MGEHSHSRTKKHGKRRRRRVKDSSNSDSFSPSPTSSDSLTSLSSDDERSKKRRRSNDEKHHRKSLSRKDKKSRRDKKHKRVEKERRRSHKSKKDNSKKKKKDYSDPDESGSDYGSDSNLDRESPEEVVKCILEEFPAVAGDLEQLLHMIDDGQAVDIKGLSEKSLIKHLRRLFVSLNLKEKEDNCFLLPSKAHPTLEVVGAIIQSHVPQNQQAKSENGMQSVSPDSSRQVTNDAPTGDSHEEAGPTRRRC